MSVRLTMLYGAAVFLLLALSILAILPARAQMDLGSLRDFLNQNTTFMVNGRSYTVNGAELISENCQRSGSNLNCMFTGSQGTLTVMWRAAGAGNGTGGAILFGNDLYVGLRNSEVSMLQWFLIQEGYLAFGNDTGYFGPLTQAAVMRFQGAHGLPQTGFVGPFTRAEINRM